MSSSSTETLVDVTMPQMGVSVAEGTVVEWKKQVGDWVEADEIIASISTDKIDTDVEAPATGRVAEIIVDVGETVDVGIVMARIATDARPGEAHASENAERRPARARPTARRSRRPARPASCRRHRRSTRDRPAQPAAARRRAALLARRDADGGRARPRPRRRSRAPAAAAACASRTCWRSWRAARAEEPPMHIESPYRPDEPAPAKTRAAAQRVDECRARPPRRAPAGGETLSRMRQAIGARMVQSLQTAATCTTIAEADMTRIEAARKTAGFSYLPYQARATIETLLEFPALNATLEGDKHTVYDAVHLGIAVSLGEGGLIVPVIRDAQELSRRGPGQAHQGHRAARARRTSSTPDEVRGGTFTITNPGGYGSIMATPVINLPQVGDPRHRGRRQAAGRGHRRARQRLDRDPPMTYLCMSLGPPRARRRARRAVPQRAAQEVGGLADLVGQV